MSGRSYPMPLHACAQPLGGKLEKFRDGFDIPIGVADIDMAKVGRQLRPFHRHLQPGLVPVDQRASGKAVADVLQARAATAAPTLNDGAQADCAGELGEGAADRAALQPGAALGNEERLALRLRSQLVPPSAIALQRRTRGDGHRHQAGLAELGLPNREDAALQIHIRPVERQRFAGAQASSSQQSDEGRIGRPAQALGRR